MPKITLGSLTMESLLATEKLMMDEAKAQGSTPQSFSEFIASQEQAGIEEREENVKEEEAESEGEFGSEETSQTDTVTTSEEIIDGDGEDMVDQEDDLQDHIPEDVEPTNEALNDWITSKTQDSDSAFIRNAGEVAAGLTRLGIKYGPSMLNAMYKGTLWTFSRIGEGVFASIETIGNYIEKSVNSIDKLDARLKAAERVIVDQLNDGVELKPFQYKKQSVLNYLRVGKNLDIASNLRIFAGSLTSATNSIASEFENGVAAVDRLSKLDGKNKEVDFASFMTVTPPSKAFKSGGVRGEQVRSTVVKLYHTDPLWPGDTSLVFSCPSSTSSFETIVAGYKASEMYVDTLGTSSKNVAQMRSLAPTDLILIAKSARILVSACRQVTKTQEKMKKLDEGLINSAKRLFFEIADNEAKFNHKDKTAEMMHLRVHLASKVFVKGTMSAQTHASRVLAAAVKLLEDHAQRLATQSPGQKS